MRTCLWGSDTNVDFDRGLAYAIGQVRTALGDTADNPRFVQTLPRRGYRVIAPVSRDAVAKGPVDRAVPDVAAEAGSDSTESTAAPAAPSPVPAVSRRTWPVAALSIALAATAGWLSRDRSWAERQVVAVALFDHETGIPAYDRLAAGAADVMVHRLTRLGPAVGVIGNVPIL